jgi:hypothetical protein
MRSLAALAVVFNLAVLPRLGGRRLYRAGELAAGRLGGDRPLPGGGAAADRVFPRRLEVAAAVWGILAFGDGMASIVGMTLGRRKLPWNPRKSWAGTARLRTVRRRRRLGRCCCGRPPARYEVGFALAPAFAHGAGRGAARVAAPGARRQHRRAAGRRLFLLYCVLWSEGGWGWWRAGVPHRAGDRRGGQPGARRRRLGGAHASTCRGRSPASCSARRSGPSLGWRGYLLLLAFFVLGTAATKLGYRRRRRRSWRRRGRAARRPPRAGEHRGGRRLRRLRGDHPVRPALRPGARRRLRHGGADTVSSEVGQLWGGAPS